MLNYFAAVVIVGALGIWFHAVYRWWHAYLLHLASSNDLEHRRKIAGRHFRFVLFSLGGAIFCGSALRRPVLPRPVFLLARLGHCGACSVYHLVASALAST